MNSINFILCITANNHHKSWQITFKTNKTTPQEVNTPPKHTISTYSILQILMEPSGLEPLTPCMPCRCSTSWAMAPNCWKNLTEINLIQSNHCSSRHKHNLNKLIITNGLFFKHPTPTETKNKFFYIFSMESYLCSI